MLQSWISSRRNSLLSFMALVILALAGGISTACSRNPTQRRDSYFQKGKQYFQQKKYADASIEFKNAVKIDSHFVQGYYYLGLTQKKRGNLQAAFRSFSKELEIDPHQTAASLELGNLYLLARRPGEAAQIAEGILTREPDNSDARLLRAQSYLAQKKYADALKDLDKFKASHPTDPPIYLAIGIAQLGIGQSGAAESNFRKAIALDPTSAQGYRDLANLYQKVGRPSEAEKTLRKGLKAGGNPEELYFSLADLYCRWGRMTDARGAIADFEKTKKPTAAMHSEAGDFWVAHNKLQPALDEYEAAFALKPSLMLKKKLVNVYITLDNVPKAERWNQEILQANPKDQEGLMFSGAIAHLRGENRTAVAKLTKALQNNPRSVFAHFYLGAALMALGENDKAKSEFFSALKIDSTFTYAFLRLGELSLHAKDAPAATQYAIEVMQLSPSLLQGYLLATDAAILNGDTARAQKALQLAEQLAPQSTAVRVRQALVDGIRKNYAKAEREYQAALSEVKDPTPILAKLAELYVEQRQTDKAIRQISSYAKGSERNAQLFVLLAQLHILQNDLTAASSDCHRALQIDGQNPRAYFFLGRIAQLRGNEDEALKNYARAGQLYPKDSLPNLLAGNIARKLGQWSEAQKYYKLALRPAPAPARARSGLARAMMELGEDPNVALSLAQRARADAPSDPVVADDLGWVYFKKGIPQLAVPLLKQSVAEMPKDANFQFHLGMAYSAVGEKVEARRSLLRARRLGLKASESRQAEQTLTALEKPSKSK